MDITVKRVAANEADEASYTLVFESEEFRFQTSLAADEFVRICKIVLIEEAEVKAGFVDQIQDIEIKH